MDEIEYFTELKKRAFAIRSRCELGQNANIVSIMEMIISKELSESIEKITNHRDKTTPAKKPTIPKKQVDNG